MEKVIETALKKFLGVDDLDKVEELAEEPIWVDDITEYYGFSVDIADRQILLPYSHPKTAYLVARRIGQKVDVVELSASYVHRIKAKPLSGEIIHIFDMEEDEDVDPFPEDLSEYQNLFKS